MDFDKNGYVECKKCHGQRVIPIEYIPTIGQVCPKCGGKGGFDWVENAMGSPAEYSRELHSKVTYENIQKLIVILRDEALKVNMRAVVTMEQMPQYVDYPSIIFPSKNMI